MTACGIDDSRWRVTIPGHVSLWELLKRLGPSDCELVTE